MPACLVCKEKGGTSLHLAAIVWWLCAVRLLYVCSSTEIIISYMEKL